MIDAKELRLGSYIYDENLHPQQVSEITNFNRVCLGCNRIVEDLQNSTPIPLTEELLLKCGLKYVGAEINGEIVQQFSLSDLKNICFGRNNNGIYLCTSYNNGYAEIDSLSIIKRVTYLHQLQNLYFDLTGKELEVTL